MISHNNPNGFLNDKNTQIGKETERHPVPRKLTFERKNFPLIRFRKEPLLNKCNFNTALFKTNKYQDRTKSSALWDVKTVIPWP